MTDAQRHLDHARELLRAHPVFDGHNDLPWAMRRAIGPNGDLDTYDITVGTPGHTDLPRLRAGGVGAQFWSVYVPVVNRTSETSYAARQLEQIDLVRRLIDRHPDDLAFCTTADEVEAAIAGGRIASLLGMEGGHVIEDSLGTLRMFRELGAAYLTLTHSATTGWADSATDAPRHGGLSPFGRDVVREMNRMGMLVDCSHVSAETMADALDTSAAPIIFSHSSARAVCDHPRNVPDDILARIPGNGGICMVTFVASFVSPATAKVVEPVMAELRRRGEGLGIPEMRALQDELLAGLDIPLPGVAEVADHVDHVARVAGHHHVGLGGDFDGTTLLPHGLEDVSCYPRLIAELIGRGWTDEQLAGLNCRNMLRVMRAVESAAG